jgi:hypothetical protein
MPNLLSDLTEEVVDHLFNIDTTAPKTQPTFVFMVGVPGVGKSSAHSQLYSERLANSGHYKHRNNYVKPGEYATINLDTLLESLTVFRVASFMYYIVKQVYKDPIKYNELLTYISNDEDLGLFQWYDTIHTDFSKTHPDLVESLDAVRKPYLPYKHMKTGQNIITRGTNAIYRGIRKSISIVYETTLTVSSKTGKVDKVDAIMDSMVKHALPARHRGFRGYRRVILFHIKAPAANVQKRITARQETKTPYEDAPFYRHVPANTNFINKSNDKIEAAIDVLKKQYGDRIVFTKYTPVFNESKIPTPRAFSLENALKRAMNAYGTRKNNSRSSRVNVPTPSATGASGSKSRSRVPSAAAAEVRGAASAATTHGTADPGTAAPVLRTSRSGTGSASRGKSLSSHRSRRRPDSANGAAENAASEATTH